MPRKQPLSTGEIYHVMNKSIAGFQIFNDEHDYLRTVQMVRYFSLSGETPKFSKFLQLAPVRYKGFEQHLTEFSSDMEHYVELIAFCLMPTHIHLITKQVMDDGITTFMRKLLDTYTRYFNTKYKRKGPLWEGRFKNVHVKSDEQLLHLTRYIHLNPVTAGLVKKADSWKHSSLSEFISKEGVLYPICKFKELLNIKPKEYESFVNDHISFQRDLAKMKKLVLE